jgi:ribulose-phosphate 3-epimerase
MSRLEQLERLREAVPAVMPSLLMCDFGNLQREIERLEQSGVAGLHLDVMDGHFVPNLTYGMPIVSAVSRLSELPVDVHLMISEPQRYLHAFCEAGADLISFHAEAVKDPQAVVAEIRRLGVAAGIAINPGTPLSSIESCLGDCDFILVMSVEAGFGGQSFRSVALDRLRRLREMAGSDVLLEVDGGINEETIRDCAQAGAQLFVAGSAVFGSESYRDVVQRLVGLAADGTKV